jgi:hypothetical protein
MDEWDHDPWDHAKFLHVELRSEGGRRRPPLHLPCVHFDFRSPGRARPGSRAGAVELPNFI